MHPKLTSAQIETRNTNLHAEVDQAQLMATLEERINRVRQPALEAPAEPSGAEPEPKHQDAVPAAVAASEAAA